MQYATAAVEALSNIFSARTVKSFLNGPPAHFDPTVHTMRGWQKKFRQVWLKEGFGAAYNNLRMSTVHRSGGTLVGTDHLGNVMDGATKKDAGLGVGQFQRADQQRVEHHGGGGQRRGGRVPIGTLSTR